jgi:nitrogen regulatory protein P-II 2
LPPRRAKACAIAVHLPDRVAALHDCCRFIAGSLDRRFPPVIVCAAAQQTEQGGAMKLITAIIKPFKLEDVREALVGLGVQGMTVTEVKGFGRQKGQTEIYRGAEYTTNMVPKIKLEIVAAADLAPRIVETIRDTANTGAIGDGKIFVVDVGQAVRIRTGETDDLAI